MPKKTPKKPTKKTKSSGKDNKGNVKMTTQHTMRVR